MLIIFPDEKVIDRPIRAQLKGLRSSNERPVRVAFSAAELLFITSPCNLDYLNDLIACLAPLRKSL